MNTEVYGVFMESLLSTKRACKYVYRSIWRVTHIMGESIEC